MIELTAKLTTGTVYLAGEALECCITFCHTTQPEHRDSQSHSDALESLAWASAQIHCVYSTLGHSAVRSAGHEPTTSLEAAAADNGQLVFHTKPKILFCDLALPLGESKTFWYRESLPIEVAPSYRGSAVKFSYKVSIATQQVGAHIRLLRLPFRVLPLAPLMTTPPAAVPDTADDLQPNNPFSEQRKVDTPLTMALQVLQNVTARRSPNSYLISNARGRVARFCLFKHAYKLGEDIVGTFDFSVGTVSCVQVSVSLQPEETVKWSPAGVGGGAVSGAAAAAAAAAARAHYVTAGVSRAQLVLPIPLHITPAFDTPQVSLRWHLHFEFVTSSSGERLSPAPGVQQWAAPTEVPVETMVWNLPVQVFCTPPKHIAQQPNRHTLLIK